MPHQLTILLMLLLPIQNCKYNPEPDQNIKSSITVQKPVPSKSSDRLLADSVTLHISNGSLSPEYQFSKEWMLTEKEAVFRETTGEEPEVVMRKKMDPQFWKSIRSFDQHMNYKPTDVPEGAEEAFIVFHSGGKIYRFPYSAMQGKVSRVQNYFGHRFID